jgi:sporulation protein YlmC with PRC-barrel domain
MKPHLFATSAALALAMSMAVPGVVLAQETSATGTVAAPAGAVDAQELIGRNIQNAAGETVGEIKNVVIDQDGKVRYVVAGVGGFLGMGEKHVALSWDELTIAENGETVTAAVTKEQLQALPEHSFPPDVKSGTVYSYDEDVKVNPYIAERDVPSTEPMTPGEQTTALETVSVAGIAASKLVGADVSNPQGESIGEVNEVILDDGGQAEGLLIDVGGFLGVGERRVLVAWSDVTIHREDNGSLTVATALDKARLETLPEYRIPAVQ